MNNVRLEALLRQNFSELSGRAGCWMTLVQEHELYIVSDEETDRVRIMIPVAQADRTDPDLLYVLLLANYDLALDAKYAVHDDIVWCTFLHRLSWLTPTELDNALRNVITLADNTGSTFSSVNGDLVYECW